MSSGSHRYEGIGARSFPPVAMRRDIACAPMDNLSFYPDAKGRTTYTKARSICVRCPAFLECQTWAIETGQAHGYWGGTTPGERSKDPRWKSRVPEGEGDDECDISDDTSTPDGTDTPEGTCDDQDP